MVIVADGTIKERFAEVARGTPIEWLPPSTKETVGFVIEAIISAMASPASTSPPIVLRITSRPSISSLSSMAASRGIMCSYLVAF